MFQGTRTSPPCAPSLAETLLKEWCQGGVPQPTHPALGAPGRPVTLAGSAGGDRAPAGFLWGAGRARRRSGCWGGAGGSVVPRAPRATWSRALREAWQGEPRAASSETREAGLSDRGSGLSMLHPGTPWPASWPQRGGTRLTRVQVFGASTCTDPDGPVCASAKSVCTSIPGSPRHRPRCF